MKIVTIGDIHGRDRWQRGIDISADKYIFTGDYLDSFWLLDAQILENLWDIIECRATYPDKVILLLGNHDIHYLYKPRFRCSGYRQSYAREVYRTLSMNRRYFKFAHQEAHYLWTHAGISATWMEDVRILAGDSCPLRVDNAGADIINRYMPTKSFADPERFSTHRHPASPFFWIGPTRGGRDPSGGIFWADRSETEGNLIPGFHQIVGHTPVETVTTRAINDETAITYCDTLEHGDQSFYITHV